MSAEYKEETRDPGARSLIPVKQTFNKLHNFFVTISEIFLNEFEPAHVLNRRGGGASPVLQNCQEHSLNNFFKKRVGLDPPPLLFVACGIPALHSLRF